jgi:type II secretion system protein I
MKWIKNHRNTRSAKAGFTLVELLAAMAFMAIVIPVALQGLQIANRAGVVAQRKLVATRVMDSVLNEYLANAQNRSATQKGVVQEGNIDYSWQLRLETWKEDTMRLVTAEVTYPVQGRNYTVQESTLIGLTTQ